MGHSFRPWGAVKIARGIGNAGNVLAGAGLAIGIYLQIKTDQEEEKRGEEDRRARQEIRSHYSNEAEQVRTEAQAAADEVINEMLIKPMEDLREYADQLNHARREQDRHIRNPIRGQRTGESPDFPGPRHRRA